MTAETISHPRLAGSDLNRPALSHPGIRGAVAAMFFINGLLFASWASRVPAIQKGLGLGNGALGLALLAMAMGAFITMPLSGFLITKIGSRALCRGALLAYCAALPLLAWASGPAFFIPALFCFGAAHGTLDIAMNAQAVSVEKSLARPIMSSFHALWSVGGLTGALLGGFLAAGKIASGLHFSLVGLILAIGAVPVLLQLRDYRSEEVASGPRVKGKSGFRLPNKGLLALGIIAMCVMMGEGAMADWSAIYLREIVGAGESLASIGYAAFSLAMVLGRCGGDWLMTRFGPTRLTRGAGWTGAAGLLAALVFPDAAVVLVGFACVGAGFSTVVPMVFTAAGNTPGVSRGIALSSVSTVGYLGFLLGPPLIGLAAEGLGLKVALGSIVVASLVVAALASALRHSEEPATNLKSAEPEPVIPEFADLEERAVRAG